MQTGTARVTESPTNQVLRKMIRTVFKNASANVVRLVGSGVVALLLPSFLVRRLPVGTYSTWALLLQLTLYVGFLDFGIQTAVARFVAHAHELKDQSQQNGVISTALMLLSVAGIAGICVFGLLAWQLPYVFRAMPRPVTGDAETALLLMGISFAVGLPLSVIQATFIGLQRNEIPVAIVVIGRVMMASFVMAAVSRGAGLRGMGVAVGCANLISYAFMYGAWRMRIPNVRVHLSLVSRAYAKQIGSYCFAYAAWSVGMLMVSGLDLSIVGIFDYKATAYYAIAATLTNFVGQAQNAIFAALIPASAVLSARGDAQRLGSVLVSSTKYGMFLLLGMALPLLLLGKVLLRVWVGAEYAVHSTLIMQVLVVANVIRLAGVPYASLLLGTGEQQKVILSPLAEGITNVFASVVGAWVLGAIGVALGTLVGSFVSVGLHILYNMPRTTAIAVDRFIFLREGLFRPLICITPFTMVFACRLMKANVSLLTSSLFSTMAIAGTLWLFWRYGLVNSERQKLEAVFRFS